MIIFSTASSAEDLSGILALQQANLSDQLQEDEIKDQGFVTVRHTMVDLEKMHRVEPGIIAKENDEVIAYVLAMTLQAREHIPILQPMFEMFEHIRYLGKPLLDYHFIMIGQVCVDKRYRGSGVFQNAYQAFRDQFSGRYDFALTEIATRNTRSIRAHERIGFHVIHRYRSPDGEDWVIVILPWSDNRIS